ncbi:MAG: hypothetical protein QG622_3624 [Actinomycetota bacterium]|nr:hypothetical protein [Actinomycetota bacterium]
MNYAAPVGHPPQDVLADFAAGVLGIGQARNVEAHVMACPSCQRFIQDAERVRGLFAAPPPGPMPADVWGRVERGLTQEAIARGAGPMTPSGPAPVGGRGVDSGWFDIPGQPGQQAFPSAPIPLHPTGMPQAAPPSMPLRQAPLPPVSPGVGVPTPNGYPLPGGQPPGDQLYGGQIPGGPPARHPGSDDAAPDTGTMFLPKPGENRPVAVPLPPPDLSFDEAPTAAWRLFLNEPESEEPVESAEHKRAGRTVRSVQSRRDARTETNEKPPWRRPKVLAGLVAAGIAVLGLGGLGIVTLLSDDSSDGLSAADALPGAVAHSVLRSSGTEYTASTLVAQVKVLLSGASPAAPTVSGKPAASAKPVPAPTVTPKPGTVTDPKQLQSCLGALGERSRSPVAVDLARYQGREAAVIVLPGVNGGYDVWVVARDCRPGGEGHLAYKSIPR